MGSLNEVMTSAKLGCRSVAESVGGNWQLSAIWIGGCKISSMQYEIDGARFSTLEEFFAEISATLIPGQLWGRNLDALNDISRCGFGTAPEGFISPAL